MNNVTTSQINNWTAGNRNREYEKNSLKKILNFVKLKLKYLFLNSYTKWMFLHSLVGQKPRFIGRLFNNNISTWKVKSI
jgi:hypothetical protein